MSAMTPEARIRNLERRLEVLEAAFLHFRHNNAHLTVGGKAWVESDQREIDEARHAE